MTSMTKIIKKHCSLVFLFIVFAFITIQNTQAQSVPTFTSTPTTSVYEGDTYTYQITTNDADGDDLTIIAATLPSWLSLDTAKIVSTLAGKTGNYDNGFVSSGYADGTGIAAKFSYPKGIITYASGNIYVADTGNHRIRKITHQ